jgi:hypothetical protein
MPARRLVFARALRALAGAGVLGAAACSMVLDIKADRYLAAPADASDKDVQASKDPWACISQPGEQLNPNIPISVTLLVMDAIQPSTSAGSIDGGSDLDTVSGSFLPGISVKECDIRDSACTHGVGPVVTDATGAATFHAAGSFAGFFDLEASGYMPVTLYPGNLLVTDPVVSFPAYTITPDNFQILASAASSEKANLDPTVQLGHALVTIYDCNDHQAPGVVVSYSSSGAQQLPFYFSGGLPSLSATQTDNFGLAGAINIQAGTVTATANLAPDSGVPTATGAGALLGSITFGVRPGGLTFAWIRVRSH